MKPEDDERAELDSFVYAISHDLRAPLRAMTGFANALFEEYGSKFDHDGRRYLNRICEAAEVMGAQVEGLLELSRASRTEIVAGEFDVADFIRGEARRLSRGAPDRRIELDVPERLVVRGDPHLLREAFRRLMDNAWKFSAGADPTRISLTGDGGAVTLTDNGAGFDTAYAHKLFTPFQRLHSQDEFPGTGIGLVVVERIIRRHGGRIRLESRTGIGTSVVITLGAEDNG